MPQEGALSVTFRRIPSVCLSVCLLEDLCYRLMLLMFIACGLCSGREIITEILLQGFKLVTQHGEIHVNDG